MLRQTRTSWRQASVSRKLVRTIRSFDFRQCCKLNWEPKKKTIRKAAAHTYNSPLEVPVCIIRIKILFKQILEWVTPNHPQILPFPPNRPSASEERARSLEGYSEIRWGGFHKMRHLMVQFFFIRTIHNTQNTQNTKHRLRMVQLLTRADQSLSWKEHRFSFCWKMPIQFNVNLFHATKQKILLRAWPSVVRLVDQFKKRIAYIGNTTVFVLAYESHVMF